MLSTLVRTRLTREAMTESVPAGVLWDNSAVALRLRPNSLSPLR